MVTAYSVFEWADRLFHAAAASIATQTNERPLY